MSINISDYCFRFAFGCALRDAVLMQAYPYSKPVVDDCSQIIPIVREFVNNVIAGVYHTQNDFDKHYYDVASKITDFNNDFASFSFGNAQKLINMTFKYIYIGTYAYNLNLQVFQFCHCPMDSKMLNHIWGLRGVIKIDLGKRSDFLASWGQENFDDYDEYLQSRYMKFQYAVRKLASIDKINSLEYDVVNF